MYFSSVRCFGSEGNEQNIEKDESLCRRSAGFQYDVGVFDDHFMSSANIKVT